MSEEQAELAVETLRAIRLGEVDAFVVGEDQRTVYTLQTADRPYRLLVEHMLEGAAIAGSDGLVLFANKALGVMLRRPLQKLIGSRIGDYEALSESGRLTALITQAGGNWADVVLERPDGRRLDVLVSASALPGDDVSQVCLIFTDLTELRAKQREVDRLNERLAQRARKSESQLQLLADYSGAAISIKDLAGRFQLVNCQVERLLGLGREQLLGTTAQQCLPAGTLAAWRENDLRALREGTSIQVEETIVLDDGEHTLLSVKYPLVDNDGRPYAVAGISTDITSRKRAEDEVRRLNRDLTAALQELDAFAYSVSHDLRAPLRAISKFSQILQERCCDRLDEGGMHYLHRVSNAAERMGRIIEDLLHLSQATSGECRRESVDLTALAQSVISELREVEPGRTVEVTIGEGLTARGDSRLIRQVLANLLGNAWKFTSKRPDARIEFGRRPLAGDGEQVFFVRDNGAGFDMANAQNLFAPFQRLHSDSEFSGNGIGLATVKRIVHWHSGRIWAYAEQGQGALFSFTLTNDHEMLGDHHEAQPRPDGP